MTERPRCGTCFWFDPDPKAPGIGRCLVDPPVPHIVAVPNALAANAAPRAGIQGIRPPVGEHERCHKWEGMISWPAAASS